MQAVKITTEYITLGQLLKYLNIASSGGEVKAILAEHNVTVNDEQDNRRGRKLYANDIVEIEAVGRFRVTT